MTSLDLVGRHAELADLEQFLQHKDRLPAALVLEGDPGIGKTMLWRSGIEIARRFALTGRIWVPIGLHLAWNFAQGYLFGATVSGNNLGGSIAVSTARPDAEAWLTGGTFGPEASVFALLLVSSVTVGALSLTRKTGRLAVRPHLPARSNQSSAQAPDSADRLRTAVISTRITRLSSTSEWRDNPTSSCRAGQI